jgi:hypothetical protein
MAHRNLNPGAALTCAAALALTACDKPNGDPDSAGAIETAKIAEEAMVYGFPMIMNYGAMYELGLDPKSSQYRSPPNVLSNNARVFTPADTAVVTPNSDTPYSTVLLDLRAEPMVICVPAIPRERYYSVQLIDLYTSNFGYIGSRATGNDAGCYMVAGPDWKGATPAGIKQVFQSETQFGPVIFRTQLFNAADIDNVKKIQSGYKVQPLSAFLGQPAPPPAPAVDWPVFDKDKLKTGFFNYLAFIMQFTPQVAEEAELRARFAKIGIVPGQPFDIDKLSLAQKAAVLAGMKAGQDRIDKLDIGKDQNGWSVSLIENNRKAIAGEWARRAAIAKAGIYANDYVEALYPMTRKDVSGGSLDGSKNSYTITFKGDAMPPVNAFWSVTMYDGKSQLLIDNPINRYLINSPMLPGMVKNADGGITIHVSKKSPGKDKEANWLPAPDGPIYMVMRLYWPKDAIKNGTWQPPGIVPVTPAG